MTRSRPGGPADRGSATVLVLGLVPVLLLAAGVAVALVQLAQARQHAVAAADLAALAAARDLGRVDIVPIDPDCGTAAEVAAANGARLVACSVDEGDAVIAVTVPAPSLIVRAGALVGATPAPVTASARAGPADAAVPVGSAGSPS